MSVRIGWHISRWRWATFPSATSSGTACRAISASGTCPSSSGSARVLSFRLSSAILWGPSWPMWLTRAFFARVVLRRLREKNCTFTFGSTKTGPDQAATLAETTRPWRHRASVSAMIRHRPRTPLNYACSVRFRCLLMRRHHAQFDNPHGSFLPFWLNAGILRARSLPMT